MNKPEFLQHIRNLISKGRTEDAIVFLYENIAKFGARFSNDVIMIAAQFQQVKSQYVLKSLIESNEYDRVIAKINLAILEILSAIEKDGLSSNTRKTGHVLYKIPNLMSILNETKCVIRISYFQSQLLKDLPTTIDYEIKSIQITDVMNVELVDAYEIKTFSIRTCTDSEQFLISDDFTQWIFYVRPLRLGKFNLLLKIATIEQINGKERKRNIVLEKEIEINSDILPYQYDTFENSNVVLTDKSINNHSNVHSFANETPSNFEQKHLCCFVFDVSMSMSGEPMHNLNKGLQSFRDTILNDEILANRLEVAIVEFGSEAKVIREPSLLSESELPILTTKGTTALVDGVKEAINLTKNRKKWYKETGQPFLRPFIFLITDGEPDNGQDVEGLSKEIHEAVIKKEFNFIAIGLEGANMQTLDKISSQSMKPVLMQSVKFEEFFKWTSASMSIINSNQGGMISLPNPANWATSFEI